METVTHGGETLNSRHQKLTLQDYNFIVNNSNKLVDLTCDQLNQIVDIHGFKKMHKLAKGTLCEAVSTIDLMKLPRSTLQSNGLSSDAVVSMDDVIKDLSDLSWQECCVTSLEMINSVEHTNGKSTPSVSVSMVKPLNKLRKLMSESVNSKNNSDGEAVLALEFKSKPKRQKNNPEKVLIDGVSNGLKSGGDTKAKEKSQQRKVIGKVNNDTCGSDSKTKVENQRKKQTELLVVNGGKEMRFVYKRRKLIKTKVVLIGKVSDGDGGGGGGASDTPAKPESQQKKQTELVTDNVKNNHSGGDGSNGGGGAGGDTQQKIKTELVTDTVKNSDNSGGGSQSASCSSVINGGQGMKLIYKKRKNRIRDVV